MSRISQPPASCRAIRGWWATLCGPRRMASSCFILPAGYRAAWMSTIFISKPCGSPFVAHARPRRAPSKPESAPDVALPKFEIVLEETMALKGALKKRLSVPVIGSPLFIISMLDEWLAQITEELAAYDRAHPEAPSAPFAVNQIVHKTNERLEQDLALCVKYKAPVVITSLGAREDVNAAVHSYGGVVM